MNYHELSVNMVMMFAVRLQHPPIITDGPHNQTVHIGDTVRFSCDLLSDLEYHLQWLKQLDEDIVVGNETRNYVVLHVSVVLSGLFMYESPWSAISVDLEVT